MSDNTNKSVINIELPDSIDTAVKNLTEKPTATLGETISDCMFLVFGGISQKAALKRVRYAVELDKFKNELEEKVNAIPEESRLEPNTHVICTALDNMRFCVEEKELREMFSTLIANSVNAEKTEYVHPSFGEIIKQMTPLDATILKEMSTKRRIPVLVVKCKFENGGEIALSNNLIWNDWGNINRVAASLDNLSRLELINIRLEDHYTDEAVYTDLKNETHVKNVIELCGKRCPEGGELSFTQGLIKITDFGKNFLIACT